MAVGRSGQLLANGERLTPSFAERLRVEMPFLAQRVTFYENNQAAGRGLDGGPEDEVAILPPPLEREPLPPLDERAQAATLALVRQGKVTDEVQAMVIPSQRGVLVAVGGVDGSCSRAGPAVRSSGRAAAARTAPDGGLTPTHRTGLRFHGNGRTAPASAELSRCRGTAGQGPHRASSAAWISAWSRSGTDFRFR
ncbi:hypothetical protein ACIRS3_35210 [Streptomyces virginiae]|uniref:hypothetical protein n=1 Tax=Streptomyces virginiae TaxID=1961 RepID=UPI0038050418